MATVDIVRTEAEFLALKPEWDALVAVNPDAQIFQTFGWNYNVWTLVHRRLTPEDRLFIVRASRDGHEEEVIVPMCLNSRGFLEFIGQSLSDICSEVCAKHEGNWHVFYHDILKSIEDCAEVRGFELSLMEADSEILRYWGVLAKDVVVRRAEGYSYLPLSQTGDFAGGLSHLGKKDRKQIRALMRKNQDRRYKRYTKESDAFPFERLVRLRDDMCSSGKRTYNFLPDETLELMRVLFDAGQCEIAAFLDENDELEYAGFRFVQGGHINFSIALYREKKDSTGNHVCYMSDKLKEGDCVFDFGIGIYGYKLETFRPLVSHLFALETRPKTAANFWVDSTKIIKSYAKSWLGGVSPSAVKCVKSFLSFCRGDNRRK